MWPKAFAQFLELAPHIGRLLPLADRFLQSRGSGEDATRTAVAQLSVTAESLRGEVGEVAANHATLARLLNEQADRLATLAGAAEEQGRSSRELIERLQAELSANAHALQRTEGRLRRTHLLLLANTATSLVLLILVLAMFLHLR